MAFSSQGKRTAIQVVLAIVIVGLTYVLYLSITGPYEHIAQEQELTDQTRERMDNIRTALIHHESLHNYFPGDLDTLGMFIDTAMMADAQAHFTDGFDRDSLFYSPRSGERFEYALNDTGAVDIYLLEDPASDEYIGSLEDDPALRNTASWEQ